MGRAKGRKESGVAPNHRARVTQVLGVFWFNLPGAILVHLFEPQPGEYQSDWRKQTVGVGPQLEERLSKFAPNKLFMPHFKHAWMAQLPAVKSAVVEGCSRSAKAIGEGVEVR